MHTYATRSVKLLHESCLTVCSLSEVARDMGQCLMYSMMYSYSCTSTYLNMVGKAQSQMRMHGMAEINSVTQLRLTDVLTDRTVYYNIANIRSRATI